MPEQEGYFGIIALLTEALNLTVEGDAKELIKQARTETIRQARQSVTSLEMGLELGKLLNEKNPSSEEGAGAVQAMADPRTLSPCPFCGQVPIECKDKDHSGEYYVFCEGCLSEGPPADSVEKAYILWNGRRR